MRKLKNILLFVAVLLLLLAVFLPFEAVFGFTGAWLDPADTLKTNDTIASICSPHGGFTAADALCTAKTRIGYFTCYSPLQSQADQADCFRQVDTDLNAQYNPQLVDPKLTPEQVASWASHAAEESMSFDYQNADRKLGEAQGYFTPAGWKGFAKVLDKTGLVRATKDLKLGVSLKLEGKPEIKQMYASGGLYTWYAKFPVTYQFEEKQPESDEKPPPPLTNVLVLKIVRSAFAANTDGLGIAQWMTVGDDKPPM